MHVHFTEEEKKCLYNMNRYAILIKGSTIAEGVNFLVMILVGLFDFICFITNTSNDYTWIFETIIVVNVLFAIGLWSVEYVKLKATIRKDEHWNDILNKFSEEKNFSDKIDNQNGKIQNSVALFLAANMMMKVDNLQKSSEAIRTAIGLTAMVMVYKQCSDILSFIKDISEDNDLSLKKYKGVKFLLYITVIAVIVIYPIIIINNTGNSNQRREEIRRYLDNNYAYKWSYVDDNSIRFSNVDGSGNYEMTINSSFEIESMRLYCSFASDTSSEKMIEVVNQNLELLYVMINNLELDCETQTMLRQYKLPETFINSLCSMSPEEFENHQEISETLELGDGIEMYLHASMLDDGMDKMLDEIAIYVSISD